MSITDVCDTSVHKALLLCQQVMREREDAAQFKARIEGLVHRYEAQHLPRRKRRLTTQQIRDMDEGTMSFSLTGASLLAGAPPDVVVCNLQPNARSAT